MAAERLAISDDAVTATRQSLRHIAAHSAQTYHSDFH